jgi:hypothetical protein
MHSGKHHFDLVVLVAIIGVMVMLSVVAVKPTGQATGATQSPAISIAAGVRDCCLAQDPSKGYIYGKCLDETLSELHTTGALPASCSSR